MNFFKDAISEIQLKFRISKAVSAATSPQKLHLGKDEANLVVAMAMEHPSFVVASIRDRLKENTPSVQYLSLGLLEWCVNAANFAFHVFLAQDAELHGILVRLAAARGENDNARLVRNAARRLVLDFSRMFVGEPKLEKLTKLATEVERVTGKKLLRSILLESKKIDFTMPRPQDIVMFDREAEVTAQVSCQACGMVNLSSSGLCLRCHEPVVASATRSSDGESGSEAAISQQPQLVGKVVSLEEDTSLGLPVCRGVAVSAACDEPAVALDDGGDDEDGRAIHENHYHGGKAFGANSDAVPEAQNDHSGTALEDDERHSARAPLADE